MKKVSLRGAKRRSNLIILSLVTIFLLYFSITSQAKQKKPIDDAQIKKIVSYFKSVLPSKWKISVKENTVPLDWNGKSECTRIHLINSSETYKTMLRMEPVSYDLWFCPKSWIDVGGDAYKKYLKILYGNSVIQMDAPPQHLCNCKNYRIFYKPHRAYNSSQKNLPDKVKTHFMK